MRTPSIRSGGCRKGQSLLEAMIALAVFTTGFLGILTLLSQSLSLSRVLADQTTATYLASEGIEIAKNLNDHDVYAHLASPAADPGWGYVWNAVGGSYMFDTGVCTTAADPTACAKEVKKDRCPGGNCKTFLNYNAQLGMYGYTKGSGWVPTNFLRAIYVTVPPGNPNEIIVTSIVTWSTGSFVSQSLALEDHFYNWHP